MIKRIILTAALALSVALPSAAADKKPLVLSSTNQQQQIQSGDTLLVPALKVSGVSGSTQCLQASTTGSVSGTGAACAAGTVSTTGSPASGNLAKFSGSTSVTNADLTGDVTTSSGVATTLATVNSDVGSFTNANITVNAKGLVTAASSGSGGGAGAMVLIGTVTTSGSQTSVTFSSIPGSYTHLRIIGAGRSARSATADSVMIQFNSDTTNGNYGSQQVQGNSSSASAAANPANNNYCFDLAGATATANQSGTFDVLIPMYASTTFIKAWQTVNGIPGFPIVKAVAGRWNVTTAITSITFVQFTGAAYVNGSVFSLYGIT